MSGEKFSLRWNDFETNINEAFRELRDAKDFFDVTLVCEDDQVQAHKVVLGACSSFFRAMLRKNTHQHPLIYLRGVQFSDLQSVLNFMYQGEVNIAQEELNSFLAVAEDLRVKGLTQKQTENEKYQNKKKYQETFSKVSSVDHPQLHSAASLRRSSSMVGNRISSPNKPFAPVGDDDDIQELPPPVKSEPVDSSAPAQDNFPPSQASYALTTPEDYQEEEYGEFEQYEDSAQYQASGLQDNIQAKGQLGDPSELLQFVRKDPGDQRFHCILCDRFSHTVITCTRNHVESQHYPDSFTYPCDLCDQILTSRNKLNNHKRLKHKKQKAMF